MILSNGYTILLSADIDMEAAKIIRYYSLQFQIEFLIRYAKQHTGLKECQAISETTLYNHFNFSLMTVSLMKLTCWAELKPLYYFILKKSYKCDILLKSTEAPLISTIFSNRQHCIEIN